MEQLVPPLQILCLVYFETDGKETVSFYIFYHKEWTFGTRMQWIILELILHYRSVMALERVDKHYSCVIP